MMTYTEDDRYTDSNQQPWMWRQTFWEQTNLLLPATEWWTDGHTDAWRQVKRRNHSWGVKNHGGQMEVCMMKRQSKDRKEEGNDACWRSDRSTSRFECPIQSIGFYTHHIQMHTHKHTPCLHMDTEIGLLITLGLTDLKGQPRCLWFVQW